MQTGNNMLMNTPLICRSGAVFFAGLILLFFANAAYAQRLERFDSPATEAATKLYRESEFKRYRSNGYPTHSGLNLNRQMMQFGSSHSLGLGSGWLVNLQRSDAIGGK
jgi:hypothetical protein